MSAAAPAPPTDLRRQRWRLLRHVSGLLDTPMTVLAFVWLILLVIDLTSGLSPVLTALSNVIWVMFVVQFTVEWLIAPRKLAYLRRHWLTALALVLPAFRVLRVFRAVRALRAARAARPIGLLRVVTSLNRGLGALRRAMSRRGVGFAVLLTLLVLFTGAAGMEYFENTAALRDAGVTGVTGLDSYGESLWWTAMVLTTMGTDYWPRTAEGRVLCGLLALYAFAVFGYITATVASYFLGSDRAAEKKKDEGPAAELRALRAEIAALRTEI